MTPSLTSAPPRTPPPEHAAGGAKQDEVPERVTRGIQRLQRAATRTATRADIARRYTEHRQSINQIRREIGRSYGFVHRLLVEAGVTMRPRGGNTRGKR